MKKTAILIVFTVAFISNGFAQTVYTVNSNANYSASCNNCTFNISAGVTLTINQAGTCNNCTFNGGNIQVNNNITCQPCTFSGNNITMTGQSINPNSKTTSFNNVVLTANGASSITANTPVAISNSVFTFNGTSYFNNNGGQLDITASTLNFFGDSYFIANAGPVNLKSASKLVAGNGAIASKAYIKINGPALNIYDAASKIVLGNNNNFYFNWGGYNSISNNQSFTTTYPSTASTLNCGGAGQNACGMWSAPTVYGPSVFNSTGVAAISSALPIVLTDFSVTTTGLSWTTAEEINADYFIVEYSATGVGFEKAGIVAAKGSMSHYTYNVTEAGYYRLAMVDKDGTKAYSAIKMLNTATVKGVSFYPNPVVDMVNVSVAGQSTVQLLSQSGQVLLERKSSGKITLDVKQFAHGMYILKVVDANGNEQTGKMMIAH